MKSYDWVDSLVRMLSERGRGIVRKPSQAVRVSDDVEHAIDLCNELLSESGEALGTALAQRVVELLSGLDEAAQGRFLRRLADDFGPNDADVRAAFELWTSKDSPGARNALMAAIEGRRQRLFRRINMAPSGTAALVQMRGWLLRNLERDASLREVDDDLRHLLVSWFNRGFLEFCAINWQTSADILEKLIAYESVHAVNGWGDLRRRLAPDRRCYGFFHPALPREPLIFVEVALQRGLTQAVGPILEAPISSAINADTAIFYSISNCQDGLRGVNFGNFLIKQVVDELRREMPQLTTFSTLSPVPGFRNWLAALDDRQFTDAVGPHFANLQTSFGSIEPKAVRERLFAGGAEATAACEALRRACALYLCGLPGGPVDPVAKFHLGNGARLERINLHGDASAKGHAQSFGIMVNYLYEPERIVSNHQAFATTRRTPRSAAVDAVLDAKAGSVVAQVYAGAG